MKRVFLFIGTVIFIFACSTQKQAVKLEKSETPTVDADSVEYDMETFDARFETWYQMHKSPAMFRSADYYDYWNDQYVLSWNTHATGRRSSFFEPIVGYDPTVDYGFDLNHQLFYYFQYVENVLKIKILPGSPHVLVH